MPLYRAVKNGITLKFIRCASEVEALDEHYQDRGYKDFQDFCDKNDCEDPDFELIELEDWNDNTELNLKGHYYEYD